jgi:glutaredoxin 3
LRRTVTEHTGGAAGLGVGPLNLPVDRKNGETFAIDAFMLTLKYGSKEPHVPTIEIYTKTFCPYCWRAKQLLEAKGVNYEEISVDFGGEARKQMIQRANGRTTVPQIFIREHHVGGCDDLLALERSGQLDDLISQ